MQTRDFNDLPDTLFQGGCEGLGRIPMTQIHLIAGPRLLLKHAINIAAVFVELIETVLESNKLKNQQTAHHPDTESADVYDKIAFLIYQISVSDFEVVFYHRRALRIKQPSQLACRFKRGFLILVEDKSQLCLGEFETR